MNGNGNGNGNGRRVVRTAVVVAAGAMLGAVGAFGSMALGDTGRAPVVRHPHHARPAVTRPAPERVTTVDTVPASWIGTPDAVTAADFARLQSDWRACAASGSVRCHVETDADGSESVYGYSPTNPVTIGGAASVTRPTGGASAPVAGAGPVAVSPRQCSADCGSDDTPADVARRIYSECHDPASAGWAAAHADYCARYGTGAVVPGPSGTFDTATGQWIR